MKSLKIFLWVGMLILLFSCITVWADVPKLINFQGRLTDGSGTPVKDSTYSVLFTIYDVATNGTNLWSETQSVVTKGGTFNVNLGSITALPDTIFDDTTRYLAMKVGTDPEMTPRQRMVSMAYGYRVRTVDGASGGTIDGNLVIVGDTTQSLTAGPTSHCSPPTFDLIGSMRIQNLPVNNALTNVVVADATGCLSRNTVIGGGIDHDWYEVGTTAPPNSITDNIYKTLGNVGIKTATPQSLLHIGGDNTDVGPFPVYTAPFQPAPADPYLQGLLFNAYTRDSDSYRRYCDIVSLGYANGTHGGGVIRFLTNSQSDVTGIAVERMRIERDGRVGIGTNNPQQPLDVSGTVQMTGFRFPTSPTNGYVLTSDATGTGTWQPAAAGGIGGSGTTNYIPKFTGSTTVGNSVIYESGGNVGIGTTTPTATLALGGVPARTIKMERNPIGGAVGLSLTIEAGGASVGYLNKWGGDLILQSGISTGNQASRIQFLTATAGASGTADNAPTVKMAILGNGNVGIGTTNPQGALDVSSTTGALIVPRMTTVQRDALTAVNGMIIYNTTTDQFNFREAGAWVTK